MLTGFEYHVATGIHREIREVAATELSKFVDQAVALIKR